jgi:hypothetical protein
MVKLLLHYFDNVPSNEMAAAAAGGHLDIVQMLSNDGRFDVNADAMGDFNRSGHPPPIVSAVKLEHVAMFRFLRGRGAVLDTPITGGHAVWIAKVVGFDSMLTCWLPKE